MPVYDLLSYVQNFDKETAVKVNRHDDNYGRNGEFTAQFPHCPICDKWFPLGHRQNYCDKCGQKLDFK